jgi:hypothetical protein
LRRPARSTARSAGAAGGYWTNARKAFQFAAIGRIKPGPHLVETFYLDKDELPESDSGSRLWGTNYEITIGEDSTVGATYMKWFADPLMRPGRDGLNVSRRSRRSEGSSAMTSS